LYTIIIENILTAYLRKYGFEWNLNSFSSIKISVSVIYKT
jgi:hypothetical protein